MVKGMCVAVSILSVALLSGHEHQPGEKNKEVKDREVCVCPLWLHEDLEPGGECWISAVYTHVNDECTLEDMTHLEFPDGQEPQDCPPCTNCAPGAYKDGRLTVKKAPHRRCMRPDEVKEDLQLTDFLPQAERVGIRVVGTRVIEFPTSATAGSPTIRAKLFLLEGNPANAEPPYNTSPYMMFGVGYEIIKDQPPHHTILHKDFNRYVERVPGTTCEYKLKLGLVDGVNYHVHTKQRP
jgi:hypothetical protein